MGIEDATPVDAASGQEPTVSLAEVTVRSAEDRAMTDDFAESLRSTLATSLSRPGAGAEVDDPWKTLSAASHGPVGSERAEMDAGSASGAQDDGAESADLSQNLHEARLRDLYLDLAQYQVAWRIIQKIQQDISQLMRGM